MKLETMHVTEVKITKDGYIVFEHGDNRIETSLASLMNVVDCYTNLALQGSFEPVERVTGNEAWVGASQRLLATLQKDIENNEII